MTKKEELSLEEIEKALVDFYDKKLLEEKNPYKDGFLDDAVDNFCDALKNEKEFSWLNEFGIDDKENGKANVNYGLPTHVHGDYENGLIYLCLINPGDQIPDKKSFINIRNYYDAYVEKTRDTLNNIKNSEYENIPDYDKDKDYKFYEEMNKKILSWKDNNYDDNKDLKEDIKEYIISDKSKKSILTKELIKIKKLYNGEPKDWEKLSGDYLITRNAYYIWTYFKPLLKASSKNIEETLDIIDKNSDLYRNSQDISEDAITNKIVNLELCPFRSNKASSVDDLNRSIYSEFSAYIIWNRIGKYIKDQNGKKPKFIFRSYKEWKYILTKTLFELLNSYKNFDNFNSLILIEEFIEELLGKYFFIFSSNQAAAISQNNILNYEKIIKRKINRDEYQEFVDILND